MSSQQELINAINAISGKKNTSFDTPATVIRVEGDTVWVHIDGGADETPVQKTINCEQGETVQVRISNGSAFLVGNASAPPTDDKTANVAHFVAEQADEKATEAIKSVGAIAQTVEGKVDSGDSNITDISSTMYQDAYGVNIYNDTLMVGDSYAHIDGDSFDIKQATTAGQIDNTNDPVVASFGANESFIQSTEGADETRLVMASDKMMIQKKIQNGLNVDWNGWKIDKDKIGTTGYLDSYRIQLEKNIPRIFLGPANTSQNRSTMNIYSSWIESYNYDPDEEWSKRASYSSARIGLEKYSNSELVEYVMLEDGDIKITGDVYAYGEISAAGWGRLYKKTPTVLSSPTISASATSYTFTDDAITADSVIDIYDSIFSFNATNAVVVDGSCTITFPAQSAAHKIKLFVY
ncbi:MAG: hypothetical protein K5886_02845 [Lachnospiraceae bacterium]|nr:hypothetical protein [Lachnospiraceae bacterium]